MSTMTEKGYITFPNSSTLSMYGFDMDCETFYKALSFPCGNNFLRNVLPLAGLCVGYTIKNIEDVSSIEFKVTSPTSPMASTKIDPAILQQCDLVELNTDNLYYEYDEDFSNLKYGLYIGEDLFERRLGNVQIVNISKNVQRVFLDEKEIGYIFNVKISSDYDSQFLICYNDRYIFNANLVSQYNIQCNDDDDDSKIKPRSINKIVIK